MAAKDKKKESEKKLSKNAQTKTVAKKAASAKKAAPPKKAEDKKATAKKAEAAKKATAKKAIPAKKAAPVKSAVKNAVAAKKAAPVKNAAAAKKAAPSKKAEDKKTTAKKAAPVKNAAVVKKASSAQKVTDKKAAAKKTAPAKNAADKKAAAKMAAPVKNAAAVKKTAAKKEAPVKKAPVKKAEAEKKNIKEKNITLAKKETGVKKSAPDKNETTVKKAGSAKKTEPAKKAESVKKEPAKKEAEAKKAVPAKKEAAAKKEEPVKKAAPAAKKESAASKKADAKEAAPAKKESAVKPAASKKNETAKKSGSKKAEKIAEEDEEFTVNEDEFDEEENDINDPEAAALRETLFEEKLKNLISSAKKAGYMEYQEVIDTFTELNLDEEQFDRIWEALDKNHIVLRMEQIDDDDIPDEELAMEEGAELEYDMENLEAGVTDGANIEDPVRMYLKEIGRVPLLSAEEEIELAKRMELGMEASEKNKELTAKLAKLNESEKSDKKGKNAKSSADLAAKKAELEKKIADNNAKIESGKAAGQELSQANLRLVVSIAKRYVGRGMLFLDLIQEGNLGLIKAVEKFDYRKGYKFSTYATWWIRQAITRAIADQARTIRIPVHMVETINKIIRINRQLLQELGREPAPSEIAERMDMPEDRVREILKISQEPVSLETPIGEEEDSHLGDFIQDDNVPVPADAAAFTLLREQLNEILDTLTDRERKVLTLRFGLIDGRARTLEEVGKEFSVTRERIRQIEAKALRKLRHPSRSKRIKDFLD